MAKEIEVVIRLMAKGGQANAAPPIGPALGAKGVNIMEFVKRFNAETQDRMGQVLPVLVTVYKDKSFTIQIKTTPPAIQLKQLCGLKGKKNNGKGGGSAQPNRNKVAKVTWAQVEEIAKTKMTDMNCFTVEAAMRMVAGTARSMGIVVEGTAPWEA